LGVRGPLETWVAAGVRLTQTFLGGRVSKYMDLGFLKGNRLKIITVLAPEVEGLTLEALARRCLVRDLNTLRATCRDLEKNWGLLASRKSAHGRQTWSLPGELAVVAGRLCLAFQNGEKPPSESLSRALELGNIPFCEDGGIGNPEKFRTGDNLSESELGKTPSCEQVEIRDPEKFRTRSGLGGSEMGKTQFYEPEKPIQDTEKPRAGDSPRGSELGKTTFHEGKLPQNGEKPTTARRIFNADSLRSDSLKTDSLKKDLIDKDYINKDSHEPDSETNPATTSSQERENRVLLRRARLMFGKPVNWHESFSEKPAFEILGWLAQAWQAYQRGKSDRPWGLVYRGLLGELRQKQPDRPYRIDPWRSLPDAYLEACGLAAFAGGQDDLEPPDRDELPAGSQEPDSPPEALDIEASEPDMHQPGVLQEGRIVKAWQAVLEDLESSTTRATFQTWMRDTQPVGWDESTGLLSVAAGDQKTVEWLDDRLTSTTQRLLCGILNRKVRVRFVLA
jgi:hypothetical protein